MTSVEGSRFQVADLVPLSRPTDVQPSPAPARTNEIAVAVAPSPPLPALVKQPISAADLILPGAAGSAWLASMAFAITQGASLPLLAAVGAAGLASAVSMGRNLIGRPLRSSSPYDRNPAMAATHFNYATNTALSANLRVEHAAHYVNCVTTISARDAIALYSAMRPGCVWGESKKLFGGDPMTFRDVMRSIGLTDWDAPRWTPCDLEAVIAGLAKLGPVTDEERAFLGEQCLYIVRQFAGREDKKPAYRDDIDAAVVELIRRAHRAETPTDDAPRHR